MFRERKNNFVPALKLIQDLIISGFTVSIFCFILLPILWQNFRWNLLQYSFGEITSFVCMFSTNFYASTNFGHSLVQVIAVWQAVYLTSKSEHHSRVRYMLECSINIVCEGQK